MQKRPTIGIVHANRYANEIDLLIQNMKGRKQEAIDVFDFKDPFEQFMINEVFTRSWHAMFKEDGTMLFITRNRAGQVPFHHAFSGFGQEMTDAPDGINPKDMAVGILDKAMESLRVQAQAASAVHNALIDSSFRRRYTTGSAAHLAAQEAQGDAIIEVPGGDAMVWMEKIPDLPQWIFQSMTNLDADIEQGTLSKQLSGLREVGVTTVGQQAILNTAAGRKFVAPTKQLEHLATNVGVACLRLLDMLGEKITVQGHSLRAAELEHDYSLRISFELRDPVLEMQERVTSMNEFAAKLIAKPDYWSRNRVEDATGIQRRLDEDAARDHPILQQLRLVQIWKEWGVLDDNAAEAAQTNLVGMLPAAAQEAIDLTNPQPLTGDTPGQPRRGQNLA